MHSLIEDILKENRFQHFSVSTHVPLKMVIRQKDLLTSSEKKYVSNILSHVDFLIYDTPSKTPRVAIEVDGVAFHKEGSKQATRDEMKNAIFFKCGLNLLRFRTDGSNERNILTENLESLVGK